MTVKINRKNYEVRDLVIALDGTMSFKTDADLTALASEFPATVKAGDGIFNNVGLVCIRPSGNAYEVVAKCCVASVEDASEINARITDVELALAEIAEEVFNG